MAGFNAARCRVVVKMALERTRMVAAKKEAVAKKSRKEIATLIERGKLEFARIKVETIISDDIHVELLEILELYCELLQARFALLEANSEGVDPAIAEPVAGIIYAATRTEVRELVQLREILMARYGRDFSHAVLSAAPDTGLSPRVLSKVPATATPPDPDLVQRYLTTIAEAYGVSHPDLPTNEPAPSAGPSGDVPADLSLASTASFATARDTSPAAGRPSNEAGAIADAPAPQLPPAKSAAASSQDEYQALADRFAALKKR